MNYKLFFLILLVIISIISRIIIKLQEYTQDYLIVYEANIGEKEIRSRIIRQHRGFSKRQISARELELLEIAITKKYDYDNCIIINVIKLKKSFGKGERLLSDAEVQKLLEKPGPRLMK